MSDTVEESDVEEITHIIEVITERADQIKIKVFTLRNIVRFRIRNQTAVESYSKYF